MNPLRVALDYRPALLGRSGIPRAVRELARSLAEVAEEMSLELHLFGHSFAGAEVQETPRRARLHRTRLPGRALPWLARIGLGAQRLCGGAEVFHWTDYVHPPVGRHTKVVLTLHDCAFAVDPSLHGEDAANLLARTRAACRRADVIVCPTRATADDARRALDVSSDRIRVIPFGIDHAIRPRTATPAPDPQGHILMLGTIEPRKNHLRAIAAWRSLPSPRPRLVIVGRPGWCCEEAVTAIRDAVDSGEATWFDDADDALLTALFDEADALLYPSLLEGFGFPPLEALARGIPVVAGDTPALRETCGDAAIWCDPRDIDAIRDALASALASDARGAVVRDARRAQAAHFRWADCARAHAEVYHGVVA